MIKTKMKMQTLTESLEDRISDYTLPIYTRVEYNSDSLIETETYYKEHIEELLAKLPTADHERRQQLIRADIENALRGYHKYCIEGGEGAHYIEVGATETDFEHVIPVRLILGWLIDGRITVSEAFNAPTCELSKDKHAEIGRLGWGKSTPNPKEFWMRYTQIFSDIQIETCDGHKVDLMSWPLTKHYSYFKITA